MTDRLINEIPRKARWIKVQAVIPAEVFPLWDTVCGMLEREGVDHKHEVVRNGMVLEILAAEYLASNRGPV